MFAAYAQQVGYFLSRLEAATAVFDSEEQRLDLPTFLQARGPQMDLPVELGVHHHLPVRLLVVRVSAELANEWHLGTGRSVSTSFGRDMGRLACQKAGG